MIKGIGLENFKAFQHCAYIDFKKINVFLGPNSSGKSSYLKGLLTLQNTMKSPEAEPAIHLNDRIGDFRSVVYGKKPDGKVTFTFNLGEGNHSRIHSLKEIRKNVAHSSSAMAAFGFILLGLLLLASISKSPKAAGIEPKEEETNTHLTAFEKYEANKVKQIKFSVMQTSPKKPNRVESMQLKFENEDVYDIVLAGNDYQVSFNGVLLPQANEWLVPYKFFLLFDDKHDGLIESAQQEDLNHIVALTMALYEFEQGIKDFTDDMIHIEPFRQEPKRSEMVANFNFGTVGSKGENMLTSFIGLNNSDDEKDQKKAELRDEINHWMNEFHLAESVDVEELGNNNYSLIIKNKHTKIPSNIVDVGVGTSQLLPIIVESVLSPVNSTLLIEEPETHIHPNAQAKLGELFVSCSKKYDKRFFIETHSMYLLLQLQILVAKKELAVEDIGVYYFVQDENGTHIKDLRIGENGQFEEDFPDGFFDVPYKLTTTLMEHM